MNKLTKLMWVGCALALLSVNAMATELKIGWINIERIFREAAPAQQATRKLEKEFDKRQVDLQKNEQTDPGAAK